jgi:hypothetical protein
MVGVLAVPPDTTGWLIVTLVSNPEEPVFATAGVTYSPFSNRLRTLCSVIMDVGALGTMMIGFPSVHPASGAKATSSIHIDE